MAFKTEGRPAEGRPVIQLTIYLDYLCPWCYNVCVRLRQLQNKWENQLQLTWKSYMLIPEIKEQNQELSQRYNEEWMAIAQQTDSGEFREWPLDKQIAAPQGVNDTSGIPDDTIPKYPNWSLPPLAAAKVSSSLGDQQFAAYQNALMEGYFRDHLNISDESVLIDIAENCGMNRTEFSRLFQESQWKEKVWEDYQEALEKGINQIPMIIINDDGGPPHGMSPQRAMVGAYSIAEYEEAFQLNVSKRINGETKND